MDTVARKVMELYMNQKGKDKTEYNDLQAQWLVGQGLVFPQAYDALTCVWCRKQEKLFRLQSLAAVFQHFESQSHVRSQDDGGVTHTHPAPQEQQPQVEQEQELTDEELVNDPASSGLEWSSDKHLPTNDELIELLQNVSVDSSSRQHCVRLQRGAAAVLCRASPRSFELRACRVSADP